MNYAEQLISIVEAGGKVVGSVFLASTAVLAFEYFLPGLFVGLPAWVLPGVRVVAIVTFTLFIAALSGSALKHLTSLGKKITAPMRRETIRAKLLELHHQEVLVLCKALSEDERVLWINPDLAVTISLQDKGLIKSYFLGVGFGDGTTSFRIPMEVWRALLGMEEFRMQDKAALARALKSNSTDAQILALLPQSHPAISAM
ncbi:hypothetical protein ACSQ76_08225 [Roseovarius sp. B08]|uniref:hypothetical protein n=1 Tax=Roseovarius sp. B08 TaxID=3449223 RepID=UPI003EDC3B02